MVVVDMFLVYCYVGWCGGLHVDDGCGEQVCGFVYCGEEVCIWTMAEVDRCVVWFTVYFYFYLFLLYFPFILLNN